MRGNQRLKGQVLSHHGKKKKNYHFKVNFLETGVRAVIQTLGEAPVTLKTFLMKMNLRSILEVKPVT